MVICYNNGNVIELRSWLVSIFFSLKEGISKECERAVLWGQKPRAKRNYLWPSERACVLEDELSPLGKAAEDTELSREIQVSVEARKERR